MLCYHNNNSGYKKILWLVPSEFWVVFFPEKSRVCEDVIISTTELSNPGGMVFMS